MSVLASVSFWVPLRVPASVSVLTVPSSVSVSFFVVACLSVLMLTSLSVSVSFSVTPAESVLCRRLFSFNLGQRRSSAVQTATRVVHAAVAFQVRSTVLLLSATTGVSTATDSC